MRATELRHGNLVEYNGIIWVVLSITYPSPRNDKYSDKWLLELSNGGIITVTLDECKPIPLTEEWLERFGFEEEDSVGWLNRFDKSDSFFIDLSFMYWGDNKVKVKHVHSLQNLYFALTGEELQTDETDKKVNR